MAEDHVSEVVPLVIMAIGLGMDAFSVSLGIGMQWLRLKRIAWIGIIIGIFHVIMPFIGIALGQVVSNQIGHYTQFVGGLLLAGIGAQMFFFAFNHEVKKISQPVGAGLIFLAFTVSIDSFSVGLSLGISGVKTALTLFLFGSISTILTWLGMMLGRKVKGVLGAYSELLGGSILFSFGIYLLFG
ncbi:manganese efflux pump MntP [Virgibacillus alimentarius]|uniref:Putative manganese efflux pump MntP n=1 Tax=Virgibacillus alimentarius TaxID=698769 RepID=A0ABS4SBV4_9BACI|nr:putative Mn2+ efflux pump MntP [Virgibacillus alimentarius]